MAMRGRAEPRNHTPTYSYMCVYTHCIPQRSNVLKRRLKRTTLKGDKLYREHYKHGCIVFPLTFQS